MSSFRRDDGTLHDLYVHANAVRKSLFEKRATLAEKFDTIKAELRDVEHAIDAIDRLLDVDNHLDPIPDCGRPTGLPDQPDCNLPYGHEGPHRFSYGTFAIPIASR